MSLALGSLTLGNSIGAGYLGCVGSSILYGITLVLAYLYYIHYPQDWRFQKISVRISLFILLAHNGILIKTLTIQVGSLVLLDTIHLAMTTHAIYYYAIIQFGKPLLHIVWSLKAQIVLNVIIVLAVQTLYVIRVWKLGSHFSRIWPVAVVGILVGGYVVGILMVVYSCQMKTWVDIKAIAWAVRATFATATSIDAVLAASMSYYLYKSKNSFSSTNNRIVTIIRYVLISGSLTCAASMASLFTYIAMPDNLIFWSVSFLVTKFYTISYIAMLNSRKTSQSGDSSYSVGRIITGRPAPAHHLDAAGSDAEEDKIGENHKDSLGLSSTSYRTKLDQELSSDQKIRHHTNAQPEVIGVSVTRLPISLTPHTET
ncbi:hypothetical protein CVT25_002278 [Psilocybe cyanescens]|uniref:DUF6534 domain-containing protein n=1 Tax=Psilocybe cyanescens TaxID=93625 RepID=A0A409X6L2_PSICY|nr:hypothetical protein CVT25_002278 [Psilocybe cyanescens]